MNTFLRIAVIIPLSFLPYMTVRLHLISKDTLYAREQLKSFLENLCTKVSSGKALESVFLESRAYLTNIYGGNSVICKALKGFEDQISAGIPFDEAILPIAKQISCPEAAPLFYTIANTRHLGNRILNVLRQSLVMVTELLIVTKDISSDVSQKRLESTIMSAMPFAVLWSLELSSKSYLKPAFSNPLGNFLMGFAFIFAICGFCLGNYIISQSVYRKVNRNSSASKSSFSSLFSEIFCKWIKTISLFLNVLTRISRICPQSYILPLKRTLTYLNPSKSNVIEEYLFIKLSIFIMSFAGYLILRIFIEIPVSYFLIVSFGTLFLQDFDTNNKISRNKILMMQDFPTFVGLLSTLLGNGIVLSKALVLCIDTFKNSSAPFLSELAYLRGSMSSGKPSYEALEAFADRCPIAEVSCALLLSAQYDRTGSPENLNLLKLQTTACWSQSKIAARKELEESSVKLLIPMMMQLVCVILITIVPSVFSMKLLS